MPRHAHSVLALSPLMLLAACGGSSDTAAPADETAAATPTAVETAPVAAATPTSYDCLPAHLLTVAYDNSGATARATLTLDGQTHELTQIPAASGAKYKTDEGRTAGKTLIWWNKGESGILVEGPVGGPESDELTIAECSPSAG